MRGRTWQMSTLVVLLGLAASAATAGTIDPGLQSILAERAADEPVSALVFVYGQVDLTELKAALDGARASHSARHETVVRALQGMAHATQGALRDHLAELYAAGRVAKVDTFWIANAFRVDAPAAELFALAQHPDVDTIYYNYEIETIQPIIDNSGAGQRDQRAPTVGLVAIKAPDAWALGYTGEGILVATLDTGVDGDHPALASRWRGVADPRYAGHPEWAWFDPVTNTTFPRAWGSHGTHTMGTVCGGPPGQDIGVAPGAQWIHAGVIDRVSIPQTVADAILAFQWMIDPDGDPSTNWDVPHVCSNSWGVTSSHGYPPCNTTFWSYIDACEAAGIVQIFAAGNEGPGSNTLRRPADRATTAYNCLAVAAVDANSSGWPIAGFSSRGPTYCTPNGDPAIKPDIAAPGVNVYSAVDGGGYDGGWSGTSMATPHINGVAALVRQACPTLTVDQVKQILYSTAYDLGAAGEDNSYGWGMVDALAAVNMALYMCVPQPPTAEDSSVNTDMNTAITIGLVADDDGKPNPPGALTYIITSLAPRGHLIDPGTGQAILSVPYSLANYGSSVLYLPDAFYIGLDEFTFKVNDGGEPPLGGDSNTATVTISVAGTIFPILNYPLDSDPGWTAEGQWAYGQPLGAGSHHKDPTSGHTGPNCYGYNLAGDYSNNLPARSLTTTAIDLTNVTSVQLRFWRYLGVEAFDTASVEVSRDGTNWVPVWSNAGVQYDDLAWTNVAVPISAVADEEPTVYVRWTMGPTDYSVTFPGWNIDDVEIWGFQIPVYPLGDLNCDGVTNFGDINWFVMRLSSPADYWLAKPACLDSNGDINGDGEVDFGDINGFVALLTGR